MATDNDAATPAPVNRAERDAQLLQLHVDAFMAHLAEIASGKRQCCGDPGDCGNCGGHA